MFLKVGPEQAPLSPDHQRRFLRVRLAQIFGWPLDTVDMLSPLDIADIFAVIEAQGKQA